MITPLRTPWKILCVSAAAFGFALLAAPATATLTVTPITWNVIGLDSNSPAAGPKDFPVGMRVCSDVATVNVLVTWIWDTANPNIDFRPGSLSAITIPSIGMGACADAYFEAEVTQVPAAYDTTRRYHVTAKDGTGTFSSPTPRELYVEHLISQNRNGITDVKLDSVSVPAGGTMTLLVGNTYTIELDGFTATQGYNQFEEFINFPNTIFQVLGVNTTYTSDTNTTNVPNPNSSLYANACVWDANPASPTYRSCIGGDDKAGGTVVTTYNVKILSGGGTSQTLNTLLYDFSGSSYHYNADYSTGARIAVIVDPATALTFAKTFSPSPVATGGVSTLTFTITNPTATPLSNLNFTDTFPTSPGAMVVAGTPAATTSGCGAPSFSPAAGAASLSFSGGAIAASGTCTIGVNVTAPVAGTYRNTSQHLFVDVTDTTKTASATLTVGSVTKGPCVAATQAAQWTFENVAAGSNTSPAFSSKSGQVSSATSNFLGQSGTIVAAGGNPTHYWDLIGPWPTTIGSPNSAAPYLEFTIDTSQFTGGGISISFDYDLEGVGLDGWASANNNSIYVYSSVNGGAFTNILNSSNASKGAWIASSTLTGGTLTVVSPGSSTTTFRINAGGASKAGGAAELRIDNVTFTGCADNLTPTPPPTITKAFAPATVAVNGTSTLTFTLTNPNAGTTLTGLAFADTLPSGLTVGTSGPTVTCGGLLTTTAPDTISFTGGMLAASGTCNVVIASVTATTSGAHDNISDFISAAESGTNTGPGGFATASLTAIVPPVIAKSFSPTSILAGIGVSTMTFVLTNPNPATALAGVAFSDSFPSSPGAMAVASPAAFSATGCGAPTFTPIAGATSITFSGGTIAAGGTCTVTVNVVASATGTYSNTTTAVSAAIAGTGLVSNTAQLDVNTVNPSLDLRKEVSTSGTGPWTKFVVQTPGSPIFYRFSIYNSGDVTLTNLSVSDPTLAGSPVDPAACTWPASLVPGDTASCVPGSPTSIPAVSGSHTNTATASGSYLGTPYASSPNSASYLGAAAGFSLLKEIATSSTGPWASSITGLAGGENLFYRFTIVNTGGLSLTSVNVTDAVVDTSSCAFTNPLAVGGVTVCVVGPVVASSTPGVHTNTATGHGTTPSLTVIDTAPSSASYTTAAAASADLAITKTGPATVSPGGVVTYTLTVTNSGPSTATGITVSDPLPPSLGAPSTPTSGCSIAAGTLTCSFASLASGANTVITIAGTAPGSGSLVNTATVSASTADPDLSNNAASVATTVVVPPTIAKAFGVSSIPLNGSTSLTFTIQNPNSGSSLTGVAFTDNLPAGLVVATPSGLTNTCGGTATATAGSGSASLSGATVAAGSSCTVVINVTGTTSGVKNNTTGAIGSAEGGTGTTSNTATVTVAPEGAPTITKSFSSPTVALGGSVNMSFVLTNPGGTGMTGLAFMDTLPAGLTAPNGMTTPCSGTLTIAGNVLTFAGGTLAGSASCTITVAVTGATAGVQNNTTGPISSTETGAGAVSNTATVTVIAPPTISKAFGAPSIVLSGTTSLDLTLTNPNATVALSGLSFTDFLPAGLTAPNTSTTPCGGTLTISGSLLTFSGGTLAAGASCTISVTVTGATSGVKNNTTSQLTASGPVSLTGMTSNTATVTVTPAGAPTLSDVPALGPWMMISLALLLAWGGARLLRR